MSNQDDLIIDPFVAALRENRKMAEESLSNDLKTRDLRTVPTYIKSIRLNVISSTLCINETLGAKIQPGSNEEKLAKFFFGRKNVRYAKYDADNLCEKLFESEWYIDNMGSDLYNKLYTAAYGINRKVKELLAISDAIIIVTESKGKYQINKNLFIQK